MDVKEVLDRFRADVEGCDLAAFADLTTSMILCVSTATRHAQEELDALTATAATVLDGAVAEGAQAFLAGEKSQIAFTMTPVDVRVYLRSPETKKEALICLCTPDADLAKVVSRGTESLAHIMASA
ncbi:MAG: hypothetical protein KJN60_00070 [Boseongicola sp.]|nr:hypothetical protein [Boseongicola sp.]